MELWWSRGDAAARGCGGGVTGEVETVSDSDV